MSKNNTRNFEPNESFLSFDHVELKERILEKAAELFLKHGFKTVTMDEIAKDLGISKKTIYLHYKDKQSLVFETTKTKLSHEKCTVEKVNCEALDPIDEVFKTQDFFYELLSNLNPAVFYDLQRYYPKSWKLYLNQKEFYQQIIHENIESGKKLGYYSEHLSSEILAKYRIEGIELGFNPDFFPPSKFNLFEVQTTLMENFIMGILTDAGRLKYEQYKLKIK